MTKKHTLRHKRHLAIRSKVMGTAERPRVTVYRGLRHLYVQIIDDTAGKTLLGVTDKSLTTGGAGLVRAKALGEVVAKQAKAKNITRVVFDRSGFQYHGQVKALADALRASGLTI